MEGSDKQDARRLALRQAIRFGVVGLSSNAVLYCLYLVLTSFGIDPKVVMTILFAIGLLQTFAFNKNWSFSHEGHVRQTFTRYMVAYGSAYFINLLTLIILVDKFHYPHQIIQGVMIFALAAYLFLIQKFWVFRPKKT